MVLSALVGLLVITGSASGATSGTAYVAQGSGGVGVIDASTGTATNTITVGSAPAGVAASPDGETVYVTNGSGSPGL